MRDKRKDKSLLVHVLRKSALSSKMVSTNAIRELLVSLKILWSRLHIMVPMTEPLLQFISSMTSRLDGRHNLDQTFEQLLAVESDEEIRDRIPHAIQRIRNSVNAGDAVLTILDTFENVTIHELDANLPEGHVLDEGTPSLSSESDD